MDEEFKISLQQRGNACIIALAGDVTIEAQDALDQVYLAAAQTGAPTTVILDFAGSEYITSNGLALIAQVVFQARNEGRRVCLTGLTPHLQKLCRVIGLANYAEILDSVEDVL
jgi:anti-anti-sigma factor